jgi:hypothetical protein
MMSFNLKGKKNPLQRLMADIKKALPIARQKLTSKRGEVDTPGGIACVTAGIVFGFIMTLAIIVHAVTVQNNANTTTPAELEAAKNKIIQEYGITAEELEQAIQQAVGNEQVCECSAKE